MDFCLFVCFVVKLGRMHSNMVASIQEPNYRSLFISFLKNKNVNEVFETHGGQKPWTQQKSWDIMCFLVYTPVVLLCHVHPLDIPNQCNYFNWCPWACLDVDVSLTQQQDFDLLFLLLLLLLELLFDGPVHSDGPLLLLRQTAHAGAAAPLPTASHGQKPLEKWGWMLVNHELQSAIKSRP